MRFLRLCVALCALIPHASLGADEPPLHGSVPLVRWTATDLQELKKKDPGTYGLCGSFMYTFVPKDSEREVWVGFGYRDAEKGMRYVFPFRVEEEDKIPRIPLRPNETPRIVVSAPSVKGPFNYTLVLPQEDLEKIQKCLLLSRPAPRKTI